MKQLALLSLILSLAASGLSCKTGTKSIESKSTTTTAEALNTIDTLPRWTTLNRAEAANAQQVFALAVSFISFGAGTDPEARQILESCIDRFEAKNKLRLHGVIIPWGREGEADFCMDLSELNPSLKVQIIEDLKIAFKGKELVQIQESFKNRFKP
jgi:ABC-type glycerol-3-phosphate transport system substrate-binding protein